MNTIKTKHHTFEEYEKLEHTRGLKGQVATQLMRMYRVAKEMANPIILELGTAQGCSTTVFLQACEDSGGRLVSVDRKDCSDISSSDRWKFVQSDSTNIDCILSKAPQLKNGIDVLYLDSLHEKSHVEMEFILWYQLMNRGSHIFIDDVDSYPYREGQRKFSPRKVLAIDGVREHVKTFFHINEDELCLDIMFGSTGLAHFYKLSPRGTLPRIKNPSW